MGGSRVMGVPHELAGWFICGYFMAKKTCWKWMRTGDTVDICRYPYDILWLDVKLWLKILWGTMGVPQYLDALFILYFMENVNFESGQLNWGYHFSYPHGCSCCPAWKSPWPKWQRTSRPTGPRTASDAGFEALMEDGLLLGSRFLTKIHRDP